jgi:threonine synthase
LPKLVVTQYEGCAPLVKAFEEGATHAQPWTELDVPPGGLKSTRPPGDRAVLDLLRDTGGTAVAVSSADAISAATAMVRAEGLFPCPEAGTTVVGLREAMRRGIVSKDDSVVLMMTGNGLKSTQVLADGVVRRVAAGSPMPGV